MRYTFDLHIHSAASPDGRMTPEEIVAAARAKGLSGAAICDHDVLSPLPPDFAAPEDFLLIRGEEFSTEFGHLLGLFLREPVAERDIFKIFDAVHAQGGLCVLAHPFERSRDKERLAPILPLLDGLEVWNGRANRKIPEANALAATLAAERGLAAFAGSDAHLAREVGNGYVTLELPALTEAAVRAALLRPGNETAGREGKALDVARSQWTKLRKTRAGALSYAQWLAFAGKCVIQDLF
ncbi:MAG: CehA/McbA family metallohydrolase [bacterium]